MTLPLVSCLMPTKDRNDFALEAAEQFVAQDYAGPMELVIVDGSAQREELHGLALDPSREDRRLVWVPEPAEAHNWGELLTIAADAAHGAVWANWDDDNWRAPAFLSTLMTALLAHPTARWAALGPRLRFEVLPEHAWYLCQAPAFDATMVLHRAGAPRFSRVEDLGRYMASCGVIVDQPDLFAFRLHGGNVTGRSDTPVRFGWPRLASGEPGLLPANPSPVRLSMPPVDRGGAMGVMG